MSCATGDTGSSLLRDCPVCGAAPSVTLAERNNFPVFVNRVYESREQARAVARGEVVFVACAACGHVWNREFEPERLAFDSSYDHHAGSPAFDDHVADVAGRIVRACAGAESIDLLEIGCGQAEFLELLAARFGRRLRSARGYDPAFRGSRPLADARIVVERRYFDEAALATFAGSANVVVSRHTVQHVAEPRAFYRLVRSAMSPGGRLFIEAPDVAWILANNATYDFFYEHCSLYTKASLARALRDVGFGVSAIDSVFQDQYMLANAALDGTPGRYVAPAPTPPRDLATLDRQFIDGWKARLAAARQRGPLLLWGGGAKGVSFCLLVDPEGAAIDGIVDINPKKHGGFVPGSGHEVISPDAPLVAQAKTVIVSNGNYKAEIVRALAAKGSTADVITLDEGA